MYRLLASLLLFALLLPVAAPGADPGALTIDDFEDGLDPAWTVKSFDGETRYRVIVDGDGRCLRADSRAAASGLVFESEVDLAEYPVLTWRWKVDGTLPDGDARRRAGDDYAARIYVIFPHWFFPKTRTLNYIWANRLPQGETVRNPFTKQAMMVAVQSGDGRAGEWVAERRDVLADYRRIFGEEPPTVGAVAVMTDTDNTGGSAVACYDDIRFERE